MDERQLREILNAQQVPPADENARKAAVNLALGAFDEAQGGKQKKRQGFRLLGRLTGQSKFEPRRRPMRTRYIFGGMATAAVAVIAVASTLMVQNYQQNQRSALNAELSGLKKPDSTPAQAGAATQPPVPSGGNAGAGADRKFQDRSSQREAGNEQDKLSRGKPVQQNRPSPVTPAYRPRTIVSEAEVTVKSKPAAGVSSGAVGGRIAEFERSQGLNKRLRELRFTPRSDVRRADHATRRQYEAVGRDRFANVEQNAVKRVADAPVSTFSVDVDTASYAFVRRRLTRGVLPQKSAVRVEEMINYFDYDYPLPATREQPFQPSVTVMPSPWKKGNKLIHIGIRGYDLDNAEKPRSNLVFLLDVSGSMNASDKLPLMVNSLKLLLDTLKPDDTVAIVVYAGAAGAVLEPTKVAEKRKILAALDKLRAGGSTAGAAGIRQAYALAEGNFDKKAVNRVILATDGDFNVGITNRKQLKDFVERKRKSGVFLSVLGFGQGNLNDHLMQTLAQNGNGVAAHIDTLNEARKVLVDEASSTLFPIAKDVKIQVEFNPKTVAEYRLIGYETRALKREDFKNDNVDAGDIGAGHTVTAIYEITPVGGARMIDDSRYQTAEAAPKAASSGRAGEYGFLKIRYKLPKEDTSKLISTPISAADESDGDAGGAAARRRRDASWATAVAAFGQILKGGKYTGDFSYDDVIAMARGAKADDEFGYRAEFINLVRLARSASALPKR